MKKYFGIFQLVALLIFSNIFALHRDYKSDCEENNRYQSYYAPYCLNHVPDSYQKWLSSNLAKYIPAKGSTCCKCDNQSIYLGYLDPDFRKYRSHLIHQLEYCQNNSKCHCYWPEYSSKAAEISDKAYLLFRDLITTTALSYLLDNEDEQKKFIDNPGWFLNKRGLTISFIVQQFRFSDYYHICKDIEHYAVTHYDRQQTAKIKDKLLDILEALYPKFYSLYISCSNNHPSADIAQEIRFIKLLTADMSGLEEPSNSVEISINPGSNYSFYDRSPDILSQHYSEPSIEIESKGIQTEQACALLPFIDSTHVINECDISNLEVMTRSFSIQSAILLEQGVVYNILMLYKSAIQVLTQAIKLDSSNRNSYLERALAYFETNQIDLALKDYEKAKQLSFPPFKTLRAVYIPKHKSDFAKGLLKGAVSGCHASATEMIPSIFSCCRGILHGLWAFVASPSEVSQEMIDAAYAIGEYIRHHDTIECLECVIPELRDLSLTWNKIDDYSRGQKIGYIIGKYGVEIFAPIGAVKGFAKLNALKRANTGLTLEMCLSSRAKQSKILQESTKKASIREILAQNAKSGKIIPRNSNVGPHIMQSHHKWDKVIKITGDRDEDFKKVIAFLEEMNINAHKYLEKTRDVTSELVNKRYERICSDYKIVANFTEYTEIGENFLNNAWIELIQ